LLEIAPSLLVRCFIVAGTLLEIGVFQQEASKEPATSQQGICNEEARSVQAGSKKAATV
jgi:hypothetical protein